MPVPIQTATLGVMETLERQYEYQLVTALINAAVLGKGEWIAAVTSWFNPEEISDGYFRDVYLGVLKLHESGDPVNEITLGAIFPSEPTGDSIFGQRRAELYGFLVDSSSQGSNLLFYARKVHDAYRRDKASTELHGVADHVKRAGAPDEVLEELPRIYSRYAPAPEKRTEKTEDVFQDIFDELEGKKQSVAIPFGIESLDDIVGGLNPGVLCTIAGRSGHGKSAILGQTAVHCADAHQKPVLYFTFEMGRQEMVKRWASVLSRQPMKGGDRKQYIEGLSRVNNIMRDGRVHIFTGNRTVEQIWGEVAAYARSLDVGLIVVDYLQITVPTPNREANREQQVAHIVTMLKRLAVEVGVPVLTASQLNDHGQVRESRAIVNTSNLVIELWPNEDHKERSMGQMGLKVTKNRDGETRSANAVWEKPIFTIRDETFYDFRD